jgi:hypothetical protein
MLTGPHQIRFHRSVRGDNGVTEISADSSSGSSSGSDDGSSSGSDSDSDDDSDDSDSDSFQFNFQSKTWELSAISVPPGELWEDNKAWYKDGMYNTHYHTSAGARQQVYLFDSGGVPWVSHSEFAANRPKLMTMAGYGGRWRGEYSETDHASQIAARVVGTELGGAKRATVWAVGRLYGTSNSDFTDLGAFRIMEGYVKILEHVARKKWGTRSVLSTSYGYGDNIAQRREVEAIRSIIGTSPLALRSKAHRRLTSCSQCVRRAGRPGRGPHGVGRQLWQPVDPIN